MVLEPTPQTLGHYSPSEIWAWLQDIWAKDLKSTAGINWWLGLAESASHHMFYGEQIELNKPNLEWGRIAIALYEYLDRAKNCESCGVSGMFLRLRLIRIFGHQPNDELLDAEKIISWFYADLPISKNEVKAVIPFDIADLWKKNPDTLVRMRKVKHRLGVVKLLQEENVIEISENLNDWLSLKRYLP